MFRSPTPMDAIRSSGFEEQRLLLDGEAPIRWWYESEVEGADGRKINASSPAISNMAEMPGNGRSGYLDSYHSSLIDTKMRVSMTGVTVLIDVPRTTGTRLDAVAAYAAFVGLARIRMDIIVAGASTILNLFSAQPAGRPRIGDVTVWDLAYLSALYRTPASRTARMQRAAIIEGVRRAARE